MADEKERVSQETKRESPILPTVNPLSEKSESSRPSIPAAVYIA